METFQLVQSIGWLFLLLSIINLFVIYENKNTKTLIGLGFSVTALIIFLINLIIHT